MTRRLLTLTLALLLVPVTVHAQAWERWYVLMLDDQPAGHSHVIEQVVEGGQVHTQAVIEMTLRRGSTAVEIRVSSTFVETLAGEPVGSSVSTRLGAMEMTQRLTYTAQGVEQRSGTGVTHLPPAPAEALPPAAAARLVANHLAAGDAAWSYRMLDPTVGATPVRVEMERVGRCDVTVMGRVVPATHLRVRNSLTPQVVVDEFVDDQGRSVRSVMSPLPGVTLVMVAADRELATQRIDPPELMRATLVRVNEPMADARSTRRAVYRFRGGQEGPAVSAVQRVEPEGERQWRVTIDLDATPEVVESGGEVGGEVLATSRGRSAMIDPEDPAVRAMTHEALRAVPQDDVAVRAEALRRHVNRVIATKDLAVGFATASETARTLQGDCTEHAVLLAAMLRAAQIPARVASGLIYVDGFLGERHVFGYHMWTQAYLNGRWVDLDATLGPDKPFDAAHLLLAVSDLTDAQWVNDMARMSQRIGGVTIEVLEAR